MYIPFVVLSEIAAGLAGRNEDSLDREYLKKNPDFVASKHRSMLNFDAAI